jgi:hypothetical protein
MVVSLAWSAPQATASNMPVFTSKDHKLIEDCYVHFLGTLAPGSLDRSEFSLAIEQSLTVGSRVPMQLEKELRPLPPKLESQLTKLTGEYGRYTLLLRNICPNCGLGSMSCSTNVAAKAASLLSRGAAAELSRARQRAVGVVSGRAPEGRKTPLNLSRLRRSPANQTQNLGLTPGPIVMMPLRGSNRMRFALYVGQLCLLRRGITSAICQLESINYAALSS